MHDHRSLLGWKEARKLTRLSLRSSRKHWRPWARALFDQLLRASLSVQLNLAEGYSYGRSRNFGRFLGIAFGSLVEAIEVIELLRDENVVPTEECDELLASAFQCKRLLLGLLKVERPMGRGNWKEAT